MSAADEDRPLTEREQRLMAWLDDELDPRARAEFEQAMRDDAGLAREAAAFRTLIDVSRAAAIDEPTDREIHRFWARFYNRTEWQLGWVLFTLGVAALAVEGIYLAMASPDLSWHAKVAILCTVGGGLLLLWNTLRLRLRTSRFDRYRGVMR